ncbi:MAG: ATP-binding cassette domain-containing protein, partial [Thaumarchaeota archaeon]|nr:ATP-binding cassette domain-containing protein [Nitrososphaerota archaeon]
ASQKLEMVRLGRVREKSVGSLSGGMRQRLALAMALLTDPPFLIFDEPLANIDLRGQLGFIEFVRSLAVRGTTLLIATHLTGLGDLADRVVVLNRGRVIATGTPTELMARINADETLYVRPKEGMEEKVIELVERGAIAKVVDKRSKLMVVSVPSSSKLTLLRVLLADENSGLIEDVSMDPSKIESSYGKLLQRTSASLTPTGTATRENKN